MYSPTVLTDLVAWIRQMSCEGALLFGAEFLYFKKWVIKQGIQFWPQISLVIIRFFSESHNLISPWFSLFSQLFLSFLMFSCLHDFTGWNEQGLWQNTFFTLKDKCISIFFLLMTKLYLELFSFFFFFCYIYKKMYRYCP